MPDLGIYNWVRLPYWLVRHLNRMFSPIQHLFLVCLSIMSPFNEKVASNSFARADIWWLKLLLTRLATSILSVERTLPFQNRLEYRATMFNCDCVKMRAEYSQMDLGAHNYPAEGSPLLGWQAYGQESSTKNSARRAQASSQHFKKFSGQKLGQSNQLDWCPCCRWHKNHMAVSIQANRILFSAPPPPPLWLLRRSSQIWCLNQTGIFAINPLKKKLSHDLDSHGSIHKIRGTKIQGKNSHCYKVTYTGLCQPQTPASLWRALILLWEGGRVALYLCQNCQKHRGRILPFSHHRPAGLPAPGPELVLVAGTLDKNDAHYVWQAELEPRYLGRGRRRVSGGQGEKSINTFGPRNKHTHF